MLGFMLQERLTIADARSRRPDDQSDADVRHRIPEPVCTHKRHSVKPWTHLSLAQRQIAGDLTLNRKQNARNPHGCAAAGARRQQDEA